MPVRIAVVAEADADCRLVCGLIDRKIRHHLPEWMDPDHLEDCREWCGLEPGAEFTKWSALKHLKGGAVRQALRRPGPLGFSETIAPKYDGAATRVALIAAVLAESPPDVVVLVRDMDQQGPERRASIETERERVTATGRLKVLLALPAAKREAWVLNGFVAKNKAEEAAVAELKSELGFHPCESAHQLTTTAGNAKDAKRVLRILSRDDQDRETDCWEKTDWHTLRARGYHSGLQSFLTEVQSHLLPSLFR